MTSMQLLERIKDREYPKARPHRWEWVWTLDGKSVTKQMNTLIRKKIVHVTYHSGGSASVSPA